MLKSKLLFCLAMLVFAHQLEAYIVSQPPHQTVFIPQIHKDHVLSASEEQRKFILDFIQNFDLNQYEVHMVPNLGLFFLDANKKLDVIKDVLRAGHIWETHIEEIIKQYTQPGTIALDVGAHIGTHTLSMARATGKSGKVIAFEPQLKTCREHFMNAELNGAPNIYTFWAAVGDEIGEISLPNFINGCEISQLHDQTRGLSGFKAPMITLDSLNLDNISFMKVDVDGWEGKFLDGAKETILRNKPIIMIEIEGGYNVNSPNCPPEAINRANQTKEALANLGYHIHKIATWDYLAIPK